MSATGSARVTFIGGGNMASSLVGGLLAAGHDADLITVCDPSEAQRSAVSERFGVTTAEHASVGSDTDMVVLAVKPNTVETVCRSIADELHNDTLVLSVAAGTLSEDIDRWLGGGRRVARCMPNTPALFGAGASVLFATASVDEARRELAAYALSTAGGVWWVEHEAELDAVTALSGSGPAYGFLLIESMTAAGVELGLNAQLAEELAVQTLLGAAVMAQRDARDPATLREAVTSKGGTTAAALTTFEKGNFRGLVLSAMTAARDRAEALSRPTGD